MKKCLVIFTLVAGAFTAPCAAAALHISTSSVRLLDPVAADTKNPLMLRQQAVSSMRNFGTKNAAARVKLYINDKDAAVKGEARKSGK